MTDEIKPLSESKLISSSEDGAWAGSGRIDEEGRIECDAVLGDDVYEAIEREIKQGEDSIEVNGSNYAWEIKNDD